MKSALLLLVCVAAMNGLISASSSGSASGSPSAPVQSISAHSSPISSSAWNTASLSANSASVSASASASASSVSASASSVSSSVSASASSVSSSVSASASSVSSSVSASASSVSASSSVSFPSISISASLSSVSASVSSSVSSVSVSIPSSLSESISVFAASLVNAPSVELPASDDVTVSKSLVKSAVDELATIAAVNPAIMTDLGYAELAMAAYPSVECAEDTIEQDERSHEHTVSLIESALSSPSTITNPTYIEQIETLYPSIVSAYKTIFDLETSHPQFAYVQSMITSLESSHPTILTDASIEVAATSPTLVEDISEVYSVLESSPSIRSAAHTVCELASHYSTLYDAEKVIAAYAATSPSVLSVVSDAVLSPIAVGSPLPAEYPTLAEACTAYMDLVETVPEDYVKFLSSFFVSSSSASAGKKDEYKKIKQEFSSFCSDAKVIQGYKEADSTLVSQVLSIVSNPAILAEPAVVANPVLAHADLKIDSAKSTVSSSEMSLIQEFECSKQKVHKSSEKKAEQAVAQHESLASAFRTAEAYEKVNADVANKVSEEMNCNKVRQVQSAVSQHKALANAFSVVKHMAKTYRGLIQAQESLDCAESHSAHLFSAFEEFSSHEASAKMSISGSVNLKKNKQQKQSMHMKQSMHQSAHQSAHQSMHQSAHQSAHQSVHGNANLLANIHVGITH